MGNLWLSFSTACITTNIRCNLVLHAPLQSRCPEGFILLEGLYSMGTSLHHLELVHCSITDTLATFLERKLPRYLTLNVIPETWEIYGIICFRARGRCRIVFSWLFGPINPPEFVFKVVPLYNSSELKKLLKKIFYSQCSDFVWRICKIR